MLLSRLFGWFKKHNTFSVFMLEILAVFIGITASLFVDNWRQQRVDYESLDNELRTLHFELQRSQSNIEVLISQNNEALESSVLLAFGDTSRVDDAELLRHFWHTAWISNIPAGGFTLQATNANLSIPFNDNLALIESTLKDLEDFAELYSSIAANVERRVYRLLESADLVPSTSGAGSGIKFPELVDVVFDIYELTGELSGEFVADAHNLARIRAATEDPAVLTQMRQLVAARQALGIAIILLVQAERDAIDSIRRISPDLRVPFVEVGIDGSATPFGWQTYIEMQRDRDDPAVWRITLDFVDGEMKFRADQAWAVNWGSSVSEAGLGRDGDAWSYTGDISAAFPRGVAQLNGSNIPVRAGRYEVTFNTETLEYSFEEVPATD